MHADRRHCPPSHKAIRLQKVMDQQTARDRTCRRPGHLRPVSLAAARRRLRRDLRGGIGAAMSDNLVVLCKLTSLSFGSTRLPALSHVPARRWVAMRTSAAQPSRDRSSWCHHAWPGAGTVPPGRWTRCRTTRSRLQRASAWPQPGSPYTEARRMVIAEQRAKEGPTLFPELMSPVTGRWGRRSRPSTSCLNQPGRSRRSGGRMSMPGTRASRTVTESSGHGSRAAGAPIMRQPWMSCFTKC